MPPPGSPPASLRPRACRVRTAALYETVALRILHRPSALDAVVVHSPKAARKWRASAAGASHLRAFALSPNCAAPLDRGRAAGHRRGGRTERNGSAYVNEGVSQTEPLSAPAKSVPSASAKPRPTKARTGPAYWAGLTFGAVCIFLGLVLGL